MQLTNKKIKDLNTNAKFIGVYCNSKHRHLNLERVNKFEKLHAYLK